MLLTETIKRSTSAIQQCRSAQENKKAAENYAKALGLLAQASEGLKTTLECTSAMKEKGIVDQPLMSTHMREELLDCANNCGQGVFDGTLTLDMVTIIKSKRDTLAGQIQIVWKDAATKYAGGTKGYLSMIGGLSDNPKKARDLADSITKTIEGALTTKAIDKLVADVSEAKRITEAFSLSPEIETFLKKVSSQNATVADLTPNVLKWLTEKNLTGKLKLRF